MPSFSIFSLHQRGEAAGQGISPKVYHHLTNPPKSSSTTITSTPVRERIKTGLKDYDSSFRKFIARKLDESSSRRNRPAASSDGMPSTASLPSSSLPDAILPFDHHEAAEDRYSYSDGVGPLEKHYLDRILPFPVIPYSESPPPQVTAATREDSWYTDTTDVSVLERQDEPSSLSSDMKRFSGQLPASSATAAAATAPSASNRTSRSFKGPDRLRKRYSHGSTIRSSFTPSLWSRLSTSSSTSTLSQSVVDPGELPVMMTTTATAANGAPPHEVRDTKRLRLSSPASSQINLDSSGLSSHRQSWDVSYSNASWAGASGWSWEPPPYDAGRPEIRVLTGNNATGSGPDSLPCQMQGLGINGDGDSPDLDLDLNSDRDRDRERDPNPEPQNQSGKALSIISEACTDASHCPHDNMQQPSSPDGQASLLVPRSPNLHHAPANSFSSQMSDNALSIRSRIVATPATATVAASTPATSVGGYYGDTNDEAIDMDEDDDDDDLLSDVSEETDGSFIEAFYATSLHPDLLPQVLTLRRNIMSLVEAGVLEWMRTCTTGTSGQHQHQSGSQSSSQTSTPASQNQGGRGVKRSFNDDQSSNNGGGDGDGDDGQKRRKAASPSEERATIRGPPLACPFVKRHARHDWPTVCQTGFLTMSRLKEHIYRKHTHPPHCKRCFAEFKTEAELGGHAQQDVPCDKATPPPSTIGRITEETRKRVKSRRGIQNQSEHDKWNGVYQILFPGEAVPERPYADFGSPDRQRSLEELIQFRQQSGQLIRERLRRMPITDEVTQLIIRSVEEVFNSLRPDSVVAAAATMPPIESEAEPEPKMEDVTIEATGDEDDDPAMGQPTIFSGTGAQFPDTPAQEDRKGQSLVVGDDLQGDGSQWEDHDFNFQQALWGTDLGNNGDTLNMWQPNNSR